VTKPNPRVGGRSSVPPYNCHPPHTGPLCHDAARPWIAENLRNALIINVLLGIFNLPPPPPLDGGRILVGVLPESLAAPLMRMEPYGLMLLIGLLFILPLLGAQLGIDFNIVWRLVQHASDAIIDAILRVLYLMTTKTMKK
jgi:Zn-dependent protease